ncbi:hypothetical protein [Marinifilum sp.]|uniref:hypothetical protein n=1 Tax=Marinifilum sp. TaxID=2033137 RepID=UPI003BAB0ED0
MTTKNRRYSALFIPNIIAFTIILIGFNAWCFLTSACSIYKVVAIDLIILWLGIFVSYFIWALYYYNFGISQAEWDKIQDAKTAHRNGDTYNIFDIEDEPKYNPYEEQTFGLPGGTVRGMIAFSLLFGAIALLIVSFDPELFDEQQSFFFDQFEFFKTAFLMMIAFYFGSRSLEYLHAKSKADLPENPKPSEDNMDVEMAEDESKRDSNKESKTPQIEVNVDGNISKIPMIINITDPMSH